MDNNNEIQTNFVRQRLDSYYYADASDEEEDNGLFFLAPSSGSSCTSLESVKEETLEEINCHVPNMVLTSNMDEDTPDLGSANRPRSPTPFSKNSDSIFTFDEDFDERATPDFEEGETEAVIADDEAEEDEISRAEYLRYQSQSPTSVYEAFSGLDSPSGVRLLNKVRRSERGSFNMLNQYCYETNSTIGYGAFSEVKLVTNQDDGKKYAMKILSKSKLQQNRSLMRRSSQGLDAAFREIAVLRKLDHPNVVKLIEVLDDPDEDGLYLIFEYLENGRVLEIPTATPLPEHSAWHFFRDIVSGLEYLHKQKIVHRDLKPENLLMCNNGRIKIADFGLSGEFDADNDNMPNPFGTPAFIAPECVSEEKTVTSGRKMDIWSLGVSLYCFVIGDVPFKGEFLEQLFENIKKQEIKFPESIELSNELKDLIRGLLEKDPSARLTLEQVKAHRWVDCNHTDPLPEVASKSRIIVSETDIKNCVTCVRRLHDKVFLKVDKNKRDSKSPNRGNNTNKTSNWRKMREKQRRIAEMEHENLLRQFPKEAPRFNNYHHTRKRTHSSCSCTSSDGLAYYLSSGGKGKTKCSCRKLPKYVHEKLRAPKTAQETSDGYSSDDERDTEAPKVSPTRERVRHKPDLSPFNEDARVFLEGFLRASRSKAEDDHDSRSVVSLSPGDLCRRREAAKSPINNREPISGSALSVATEAF